MVKVFAVALIGALAGCLNDPAPAVEGRYNVVLRTDANVVDAQGWVEFHTIHDSTVSGTWQLDGVQGDGNLVGFLSGGLYRLNLHPGWADHNLLLTGSVRVGAFDGTWEFIGFAGPMKSGTFAGSAASR